MGIRALPVKGTIGFKFRQLYPPGWGSLTGKPHLGIDILCPVGRPVCAPESGTIIATPVGKQGGLTVLLKGDSGASHRLMHNSKFQTQVSRLVKAGETIALSGSTGASTAPHCHWDIDVKGFNTNITSKIDPLIWLNEGGIVMDKTLAEKLIRSVIYGYQTGGVLKRTTDPATDDKVAFDKRVQRLLGASDWSTELASQVEDTLKSTEFIDVRLKVS
jgi:hypothetical protein